MNELILDPRTKAELKSLQKDPPHALLLIGPSGSGKLTLAKVWAREVSKPESITIVESDSKGTISIDAVRDLYHQARTKQQNHQIIIVSGAEGLSLDAQNAFLKLLEEPRKNLTFILTVTSLKDVLATITSRTQNVLIRPTVNEQLIKLIESKQTEVSSQNKEQLLFMAQGRAATLTKILNDEQEYQKLLKIMQNAKKLLGATTYQRLAMISEISQERNELTQLLEAAGHMLALKIYANPEQKFVKFADALQLCLTRLRQNGNPRAQLVNLMLQ